MTPKTWLLGKIRKWFGITEAYRRMDALARDIAAGRQLIETEGQLQERRYRDLLMLLDRLGHFLPAAEVELLTDHPIAHESPDHRYPWGTVNDNTRSPRFVYACERHFGRRLKHLDLGCSGGGLVLDFLLRGHVSVGLEGSDVSQRALRAEWRVLPNNLFTCDITKPFQLRRLGSSEVLRFDLVTAWEVLEHIADENLPQLFDNVQHHLEPDGLFVGSITTVSDCARGVEYHQTVAPRSWWENRFGSLGMRLVDEPPFEFFDYCRGIGNGPLDPNFRENPSQGFHFVLRAAPSKTPAFQETSRGTKNPRTKGN